MLKNAKAQTKDSLLGAFSIVYVPQMFQLKVSAPDVLVTDD